MARIGCLRCWVIRDPRSTLCSGARAAHACAISVPPGGGHRVRSRAAARPGKPAIGYDYLHVAVDDASRTAYVGVFADEKGASVTRFLLETAAFFAAQGVRVERIMTDQGTSFRWSRSFREALQQLGARHVLTRPYRPRTNGKAERFIRTLVEEWAYARTYRSNADRLTALPRWLRFYNERRPHSGLGNQPPRLVLVDKVRGNYI